MRVRISSRRSVITWLLPSLLSLALVGCAMSEERVVARAEGLAAAGRGSDALRLLGNYLERTPQAAGPRRLKILLAIEEQQSEEALRDYEAMSASQKGHDPALLHQLALGLIRDALRSTSFRWDSSAMRSGAMRVSFEREPLPRSWSWPIPRPIGSSGWAWSTQIHRSGRTRRRRSDALAMVHSGRSWSNC